MFITHLFCFSPQGVFIFFFHVVFNKEVRKNLKNVLTGKKSIPDESSTTRASLLTVSKQTLIYFILMSFMCNLSLSLHFYCCFPLKQAWKCQTKQSYIYFFCPFPPSSHPSILSALSTATTRTQKTARCTARASASPPSPWTARSGQPRAAAATWLTHSGTTRSLTAWLLLLHCCMTSVCAHVFVHFTFFMLSFHPCMSADASSVSQILTHPSP